MNDTLLGIVLGISTLVALGALISLNAAFAAREGRGGSRH